MLCVVYVAALQVLLLGLFRLLGCAYIMLFYNIVNREINKAKKKT